MNLINGNPAADKTIPGKGGQPSFSGILCREMESVSALPEKSPEHVAGGFTDNH